MELSQLLNMRKLSNFSIMCYDFKRFIGTRKGLLFVMCPMIFTIFILYAFVFGSLTVSNWQSTACNIMNLDKVEDVFIWLYYNSIVVSKFSKLEKQQYKIPKVCYQTWITKDHAKLSSFTLALLEENKNLNPDIEFQLWDDFDVEKFIKDEFTDTVYTAFKSLNPTVGAAKADFFRYCVIYKHGGLYLDLKSTFKVPHLFGNIIQPDDEAILDIRRDDKQSFRTKWKYGSYEQWFLAFSPRHPYLRMMITRMVEAIHNRIQIEQGVPFKYQVLRLTGPDAYAAAIHESVVKYGVKHKEISYFKWLRYKKACGRTSEYAHFGAKKYDHNVKENLYSTQQTNRDGNVELLLRHHPLTLST